MTSLHCQMESWHHGIHFIAISSAKVLPCNSPSLIRLISLRKMRRENSSNMMHETAVTVKYGCKHRLFESPAAKTAPIWMQSSPFMRLLLSQRGQVQDEASSSKCCTCLIVLTGFTSTGLECSQLMGLLVSDCREPGCRANRELKKGLKDTKRWCGLIPLKHMG